MGMIRHPLSYAKKDYTTETDTALYSLYDTDDVNLESTLDYI